MTNNSVNILHVPITLDPENLEQDAEKVLSVIRPDWRYGTEDVKVKLLTEGKTNKLVKCIGRNGCDEISARCNGVINDCDSEYHSVDQSETVLVRVYGNNTELLIDRDAETKTILLLNKFKLAPQLYATFSNGLAYEFVPGCTLTDESVCSPEIYPLVAAQMALLHSAPVHLESTGAQMNGNGIQESSQEPVLWRTLDQFLRLVPDTFSNQNTQKRFESTLGSISKIKSEIQFLRGKLEDLNNPIVFCHNDLLLANIVFTKEEQKVTFIDFEYAGFNYLAYDIGNHFAEFVGFDTVDYTKFPDMELQYKWLRCYLDAKNESYSEQDLDKLYCDVNHFVLASHLLWGLWALLQAEHSHIEFDFFEYASIRFNEYFKTRDSILKLSK